MKKNCFTTEMLRVFKGTLSGLPSFPRLVMYELLSYCDYASGTIVIKAIDDITTHDFRVKASSEYPSETISNDMVYDAFYMIQKERPKFFRVSTNHQTIKIDMPFLRELYQNHYTINTSDSAQNTTSHSINGTTPSTTRKPPVFITCACGIRSQTVW